MNHVSATIAEMGNFVVDIEDVGAEIKLIALNASIKAARTGEQGRALGVLAMAIQRLSSEAREQTQAVSDALRETSAWPTSCARAPPGMWTGRAPRPWPSVRRNWWRSCAGRTTACASDLGHPERKRRPGRDGGHSDGRGDRLPRGNALASA